MRVAKTFGEGTRTIKNLGRRGSRKGIANIQSKHSCMATSHHCVILTLPSDVLCCSIERGEAGGGGSTQEHPPRAGVVSWGTTRDVPGVPDVPRVRDGCVFRSGPVRWSV